MKKTWHLSAHDNAEISSLCDSCGIDSVLASILYGRGMRTPEAITTFLNPCLGDLHSPFLFEGMQDAVLRIRDAVDKSERIAIFSDSDIDGITSLAILYDLFVKLKSEPYIRYPRDREGYGLTCDIIDEFRARGITLVVTVDCGIRDIDEVLYAVESGIDFIVTDHHEPEVSVPEAIIINPKLEGEPYPFKELAGVGVAFKLAHALLWSFQTSFNVRFIVVTASSGGMSYSFVKNGIITDQGAIENSAIEWFASSLVSVSDHVVISGPGCDQLTELLDSRKDISVSQFYRLANTLLNKQYTANDSCCEDLAGLFRLRHGGAEGKHDIAVRLFIELQLRSSEKVFGLLREYIALAAMGTIADIMPVYGENRQMIMYGMAVFNSGMGHRGIREILGGTRATSKTISWDVAPLLNTPGRMGVSGLTVEFFLSEDSVRTRELIAEIEKLNRERRKLVNETIHKVRAGSVETDGDAGFFYYSDDSIKDGLAGLIANKIAEEIKKPVIIMSGPDENGNIKGSGRSYGRYNFLRHLEPLSSMFERLGGHAQAFGFTIRKENISSVMRLIMESIGNSYSFDDTLRIDALLDHGIINSEFINRLSLLEPFGRENEEPLFLSLNVKAGSFQRFGADSNHGKFILGRNLQAIGWNMAEAMDEFYCSGKGLDIVYRLENNHYQNRVYPRMIIVDMDYSG